MAPPVYISAENVKELVTMKDIIEVIGKAMEWTCTVGEEEDTVQPVRTAIRVRRHKGLFLTMPAYSGHSDSLGTKMVTVYPNNDSKGMPSHQGLVLLFNASTGSLQALVEGDYLTSLRTAAASACAIRALVPSSPSVLCIVGTGVEARTHVLACREVHNYRQVRIWGRNKEKAERCAADVECGAVVFDCLEEAVRGADVVVTVTSATEPVLCGRWLKPGAVVCCVGACSPYWRELDDELMHNAVVTVDTRDGALKESGDIILSKVDIYAEVGEIMAGSKTLPKVPDCGKQYYLFKSLGMAIEDIESAKLVYDKYTESH